MRFGVPQITHRLFDKLTPCGFSYPQAIIIVWKSRVGANTARPLLNLFLWITQKGLRFLNFIDRLWIFKKQPVNSFNLHLSTCGKLDTFMLE